MKTLFVAYEDTNTFQGLPVARLCYCDNKYVFCYTNGAEQAVLMNAFVPCGDLLDINQTYISDSLFPFFENRVLNSSRSEFNDLLTWLGLNNKTYTPLDILALTNGKRETDNFTIFPYPVVTNNILNLNFFISGVEHLDAIYKEDINLLQPGDNLILSTDILNQQNLNALLFKDIRKITIVGYCPHYITRYFDILSKSISKISVKKVNINAPYSYRVLCSLQAICDSPLLLDDQFLPINSCKKGGCEIM